MIRGTLPRACALRCSGCAGRRHASAPAALSTSGARFAYTILEPHAQAQCPRHPCSALTYVLIAALLGGSLYVVARLGRLGLAGAGGGPEDFPLGSDLLDGARLGQQRLQQQQQHPPVHVHEDVHDRRAAMEQHAAAAAALGADADEEQAALEAQHVAQLKALEQQGHDAATAAHVAAHIAQQQAMPQREGPSLYAADLSGGAVIHSCAAAPGMAATAAAAAAFLGRLPCPSASQHAALSNARPSLLPPRPAAVDIRGNVMRTADLAGKVTIVVNVASRCGFTGGADGLEAGPGAGGHTGQLPVGPLAANHPLCPAGPCPPVSAAEANYQGLHRLYERYRAFGLQVLAFPCNQARHAAAAAAPASAA